jgi:hypothetical protein
MVMLNLNNHSASTPASMNLVHTICLPNGCISITMKIPNVTQIIERLITVNQWSAVSDKAFC